MQPLFSEGDSIKGVLLSVLAVMPIVPYFLTGFETVPKCAEEAASDAEPGRFTAVMLLALTAGTLFYAAILAVVSMLYPWEQLQKRDFATAIAFRAAFGSELLVGVLIFGAALSLMKVFNGMFLGSTRLLYALGKRGLLGGGLGTVHPTYQTPVAAIVLVCGVTMAAAFLGRSVLVPISEVGSLAGALGWLAACLALACGAAGRPTRGERLLGGFGAAVSLTLAVIAAWSFTRYHWLALEVWAALGVVLWFARPRPSLK